MANERREVEGAARAERRSGAAAAAASAAAAAASAAFKCQYCDRVFSTSQALGGHQNCHRRERDATRRAEHEAELYNLQAAPLLPILSPQSFFHAGNPSVAVPATRFLFQSPSAYSPYRCLAPRHSYYQPYCLPHGFGGRGEVPSRVYDARCNNSALPNLLPYPSGAAREEQWKLAVFNRQRNCNPSFADYPWRAAPQEASDVAQANDMRQVPSAFTGENLVPAFGQESSSAVGLRRDGNSGGAAKEGEIDLTLHL